MFKFVILQLVSSKPFIVFEWDEKQILAKLKKHAPLRTHGELEKAWADLVKEFKAETARLK